MGTAPASTSVSLTAKPEPAKPRPPGDRVPSDRAVAATPMSPPKPDKPTAPAERPCAASRRGGADGRLGRAGRGLQGSRPGRGRSGSARGIGVRCLSHRSPRGRRPDAIQGADGQIQDPGGGGSHGRAGAAGTVPDSVRHPEIGIGTMEGACCQAASGASSSPARRWRPGSPISAWRSGATTPGAFRSSWGCSRAPSSSPPIWSAPPGCRRAWISWGSPPTARAPGPPGSCGSPPTCRCRSRGGT